MLGLNYGFCFGSSLLPAPKGPFPFHARSIGGTSPVKRDAKFGALCSKYGKAEVFWADRHPNSQGMPKASPCCTEFSIAMLGASTVHSFFASACRKPVFFFFFNWLNGNAVELFLPLWSLSRGVAGLFLCLTDRALMASVGRRKHYSWDGFALSVYAAPTFMAANTMCIAEV